MKNWKPHTMKALDALHTRISVPRLGEPLPDEEVIKNIYRAAFRAADHGLLRPWRFLVVKGSSREKLGELFLKAALENEPAISVEKQNNIRHKPCLLYTSPSPRDATLSRMPSSA